MHDKKRPLYIALTLDVDPDANIAQPGRIDAVSSGLDGRVSLQACKQGLENIWHLTSESEMPMTLFWESRTLQNVKMTRPDLIRFYKKSQRIENGCHGQRHEDFTGQDSQRPISYPMIKKVVTEATKTISTVFGSMPEGFRAPYCRLTSHVVRVLKDLSYRYDTSETIGIDRSDLQPYALNEMSDKPLWELPLCKGKDGNGRTINCYLWQLCEGNRNAEEYLNLAQSAAQQSSGGLFQLALHPWHLQVDSKGNAYSTPGRPLSRLRTLLNQLRTNDQFQFITLSDYLNDSI